MSGSCVRPRLLAMSRPFDLTKFLAGCRISDAQNAKLQAMQGSQGRRWPCRLPVCAPYLNRLIA